MPVQTIWILACFNKSRQNDQFGEVWQWQISEPLYEIRAFLRDKPLALSKYGFVSFFVMPRQDVARQNWRVNYDVDWPLRRGKKKIGKVLQFLKSIFTSCSAIGDLLMSVNSSWLAIGDFSWHWVSFKQGTGFNWPANLFTGTGFF